MNELLFGNIQEKEAFENILALNQIRKCDKKIEKYLEEIEELKEEMISILKDEEIDETYVEKIHKYRGMMNNFDGDNQRINELQAEIDDNEKRIGDFQEKINEIENIVENLKKEIFKTNEPAKVIECQNEIETNNARLNDLSDILNGLISDNTPLLIEKEYLISRNNGFDFNIPNKEDIGCDLNKITEDFNNAIAKLELPVRENIEFCQKKISNRELEIEKYTSRKNNVIEAYPNALELDLSKAYEDINDLLCELGISCKCEKVTPKNIFDEDEETFIDEDINNEIEPEEIEEEPIEEQLVEEEEPVISIPIEEEEVVDNEIPIDEEIDEEVVEENEDETADEIESVSYVLSDGESLSNIAEKVYPSKDNWEAIYYYNKDAIDRFLVSNGINNDFDTVKELADDTSLFAGIRLEIPTDYNYKI